MKLAIVQRPEGGARCPRRAGLDVARKPDEDIGLHPRTRLHARRKRSAFTLIELLTVLAIIGILAAILIPTVSSARTSAKRAKVRSQFAQWGAAIEAFRQEYGYYPTFETNGAGLNKVNGNTAGGTNLTATHRFYETLVGSRRDGSALLTTTTGTPPPPQAQNSRRIQFITFTEADMVPVATTDASLTQKRGLIRDAFDGTDIVVLVDRNLDGAIKLGGAGGDGIANLPAVTPPDSTTRITPTSNGATADFPPQAQGGVRAGVVFYSLPPKATAATDFIFSWK
jgi:prepilin-type N-terminal cleavage/methylation domain-containing protein